MLFLQSCTDSPQVLSGLSSETFPASSDGTCDVSNIKDDLDMQREEEVNVKTEEEEFIDIKREDGVNCKEEKVEVIDTIEDEDIVIKEEVS
jgi:hypothetical protein